MSNCRGCGTEIDPTEQEVNQGVKTVPIRGPKASGTLHVSGGHEQGPWKFTTLEVFIPQLRKKADLITGKIVEYSSDAYQEIHTRVFSVPQHVLTNVPLPSWDGDFPCVYAVVGNNSGPQLGACTPPIPMSAA